MKIQLSYRERTAGLFMLFALAGVVAFVVGAAIQNKWLEPRTVYYTHIARGDGLHTGAPVLLSGVQIGEVGELTILPDSRIDVELQVRERYATRVRVGTTAEVRRLVGIGEKRVILSGGQRLGEQLPAGAVITADEPMDLLDAFVNADMGRYITTMDRMVSAIESMLGKLGEEERFGRMMEAFDQLGPTMAQFNELMTEIKEPLVETIKDPNIRRTFKGTNKVFNDPNFRKSMAAISGSFDAEEMKRLFERMDKAFAHFDELMAKGGDFKGALAGANKVFNNPRLERLLASMEKLTDAKKLEKLINNMAVVADEMAKMGPELPMLFREMIETMREAVVVLKALQKTWLLDDESEEVRREQRRKK